MATRRSAAKAAPSDLEVMHPDRTVTIAGRQVTVREYGFIEGQRLMPIAEPLLADLSSAISGDSAPTYRQIAGLLGKHIEAVVTLAAKACDVDREWIEALSQDDGTALLTMWWAVNGPFYMRSVVQSLVIERAMSGGATSTPA